MPYLTSGILDLVHIVAFSGEHMPKFSWVAPTVISIVVFSIWGSRSLAQGCGFFWQQQAATQGASDIPVAAAYDPAANTIWMLSTYGNLFQLNGPNLTPFGPSNGVVNGAVVAAAAFDVTRNLWVVLAWPDSTSRTVVWEGTGSSWTQIGPSDPAMTYGNTCAVYDPTRQRVLFRGGDWQFRSWDGSAFTLVPEIPSHSGYDTKLFFDGQSQKIIAFTAGVPFRLDTTQWTRLGAGQFRNDTALCFDPSRNRLVALYPSNAPPFFMQTAEWNGTEWEVRVSGAPTTWNSGAIMSFDPRRSALMAVTSSNIGRDVWEFRRDLYVAQQPVEAIQPSPRPLRLAVQAGGVGPFAYRWKRNGVPLLNGGRISGATTPNLTNSAPEPSDSGNYSVTITTSCGTLDSAIARVEIFCTADVDDGTASGHRDGGVTVDDLLYFVAIFADGTTRADVDDGSGTGLPDGGVTIDDLLFFLQRFEAGC